MFFGPNLLEYIQKFGLCFIYFLLKTVGFIKVIHRCRRMRVFLMVLWFMYILKMGEHVSVVVLKNDYQFLISYLYK